MHHADLDEVTRLLVGLPEDIGGREQVPARIIRSVLELSFEETAYNSFVAREADGQAVGYIGVNDRYGVFARGRYCQITELFVTPEFRRRGIARRLVASAEQHARARDAIAIELGSTDSDGTLESRAFYFAAGYSQVGHRLRKALR